MPLCMVLQLIAYLAQTADTVLFEVLRIRLASIDEKKRQKAAGEYY